jgi:hypothetical protein
MAHGHFVMVAWALCHLVLGPGFSRSDCIEFIFFNAAHECIRFILSLPKHLSFVFFSLGLEGGGGGKQVWWAGFD